MEKREIKFRAWHKAERRMCEVALLRPGVGAFLIGVSKGEDEITSDGKSIVIAPTDGRFCDISEFDLLQFTGLRDKNGRDIYEGNLVILNHWKSTDLFDYSKPFSVEYYHGGIDFRQNGYHNFHQSMVGKLEIGIIGNVFENPELLTPPNN